MPHQVVKVGQPEIRYLVDGAQKGGLGLFEVRVPAGTHVPPPHSHTNNEAQKSQPTSICIFYS